MSAATLPAPPVPTMGNAHCFRHLYQPADALESVLVAQLQWAASYLHRLNRDIRTPEPPQSPNLKLYFKLEQVFHRNLRALNRHRRALEKAEKDQARKSTVTVNSQPVPAQVAQATAAESQVNPPAPSLPLAPRADFTIQAETVPALDLAASVSSPSDSTRKHVPISLRKREQARAELEARRRALAAMESCATGVGFLAKTG